MSALVTLAAIVGGFCGLLGIPTVYIVVRSAIRESQALREKPLLTKITDVSGERDYWRDKYDDLVKRVGHT